MAPRIMAPRDVHALTPGPVNMLPDMAKKSFADAIEVKETRWGNYSGLSRWD